MNSNVQICVLRDRLPFMCQYKCVCALIYKYKRACLLESMCDVGAQRHTRARARTHTHTHMHTPQECFVHGRGRQPVVDNPQNFLFKIECVEDDREHVGAVTRQEVGQLSSYATLQTHLRNMLLQRASDHVHVTSV